MESVKRHKRIASLQRKLLAGIVGVIMALTGVSGINQYFDNAQASETAELVENRAEFWKVVAGEEAPSASNVQTKLAIQLRDELGEKSVQVTELPSGIEDFKAGANDFGGIEDRIGVNPFDPGALNCDTCGTLTSEMKGNLLLIKQGALNSVLAADQASVPTDRGYNLTPFDMSLPLWIGLVYTSATTAALVIAIRRDAKRNGYSANMLNWQYEGGSSSDPYRRISRRLSPLYVPIVLKLERKFDKSQDGDEVLQALNLGESEAKLRQALQLIRDLPASERARPDVTAQRELIERLLGDLDEQVENFAAEYRPMNVGNSTEAKLRAIQALSQDANDSIMARREALKEMAGDDTDHQPRGQTATG